MVNIHETISEVEKINPDLARNLRKYVKDHSYGLVFENNLPEALRLYTKTPAIGDTVNILPERGKKEKDKNSIPWVVKYIDGNDAVVEHDGETKAVSVKDIVTLVSYRDVVYPGLKEIDRIERGDAGDPVSYGHQCGELPCPGGACLLLSGQGGLYLHRSAVQFGSEGLEVQQRLR